MVKIRFLWIMSFIFIALLFSGCTTKSSQVMEIKNGGAMDIEKILLSQNYKISTNANSKYIYVIVYDTNSYSIKEIDVKNNNIVDIDVPLNKKFILSFHANRTIAYTWDIKNRIDGKIINLTDKKWIDIPLTEDAKDQSGNSADRQNFYFSTISKGKQNLIFSYEHSDPSQKSEDTFNVKLNVTID